MSGACVASHNAEKENSATVSGRQPTSRPDRVRPVSLSACAIRYTYTQPFPTKPQALCCALPQVSKNRPAYNVNGGVPVRVRRGEKGKKKRPSSVYCLCVCAGTDVLRLLSAVDRNIYQLPTPVQRSSVLAPWHYNTPVDSVLSSAHDVRSIFSLPHREKPEIQKINCVCVCLAGP